MMGDKLTSYRVVADRIEDEYLEFALSNADANRKVDFLQNKLLSATGVYDRVCILSLLCQELATVECMDGSFGRARERFDELFQLANFEPGSLISCANYYFYDLKDAARAKHIAIYAAFVAEHEQAFVRHAHQTIIRIAHSLRDVPTIEMSVRRLVEYEVPLDSPDPAIEADVVRMVRELNIDPALKAAFLAVASD